MSSEFLRIAIQLFEKYRKPMSAAELVSLAYEDGLFSDKRAGLTPKQTMKSKLSVHIRKNGVNSPFVRTRPGRFYLRHLLMPKESIYHAPPLQPPQGHERVLVFTSSLLDPRYRFQGIRRKWKQLHALLLPRNCNYMDRLPAEQDNQHKQVLTYIVVTRGKEILTFKRGTYNRVEEFLRGAICLGFGGHVSEGDLTLFNRLDLGLHDSAIRELSEELILPPSDQLRLRSDDNLELIGVINDDSSAVGRRHLAFLFRYEVSSNPYWNRPQRREKSITQLQWISETTPVTLWRFEYWSQLVLREFFKDYVLAQPSFLIRKKSPLRAPHVLSILGPVGSGKTEATSVLKKVFGYEEVNSGRILAELLGVPPVPQTSREEFQAMSWAFINTADGPKTLARAIFDKIKDSNCERILIDGVRQRSTLDELRLIMKQHAFKFGLIFVHTPPDIAYKFYHSRSATPVSLQEFLSVREAPVEEETYRMIGLADAVLYNWSGRPKYRENVCNLMDQVN